MSSGPFSCSSSRQGVAATWRPSALGGRRSAATGLRPDSTVRAGTSRTVGVALSLLNTYKSAHASTGRTVLIPLSRWRHGFESRTSCQVSGQSRPSGWLSGLSGLVATLMRVAPYGRIDEVLAQLQRSDRRDRRAWCSAARQSQQIRQLVMPSSPTSARACSISPMWRRPCWYHQHSIASSLVMPASPPTRAE